MIPYKSVDPLIAGILAMKIAEIGDNVFQLEIQFADGNSVSTKCEVSISETSVGGHIDSYQFDSVDFHTKIMKCGINARAVCKAVKQYQMSVQRKPGQTTILPG
jgi:hypothetical protein